MEAIAHSTSVRISPRKVRLVADTIRGVSTADALRTLSLSTHKAGRILEKIVKSAIANAVNNKSAKPETLFVKVVMINEGTAQKRFHESTRGRVHPYKKRTSHVKIIVGDK